MKMYKKENLKLIDGLLVTVDGDVVVPDVVIVKQANYLEDLLQQAMYMKAQPKATPMPSLDGFERKSIRDDKRQMFEVDTPIMDSKMDETLKLMDEIDKVNNAEQANSLLKELDELVNFVNSDFVIDCGIGQYCPFDTPMLGNILELTGEGVSKAVAYINGMTVEGDVVRKRIYADDLDDDERDAVLGIIARHDPDFTAATSHETIDSDETVDSLQSLIKDIDDLCNDIEDISAGESEE